jgi:hypothetical protein
MKESTSSLGFEKHPSLLAPEIATALARRPPELALSPVSFSVKGESLGNDLITESSDFPGRRIATNFSLGGLASEIRYVPNSTATNLNDALVPPGNGNPEHKLTNTFGFPQGNVEVMYVITRDGQIVLGTRPHDVRRPHPTLVNEPDPEILSGGTISMKDGLIYEIRDDSGHFQPTYAGVEALLRAFSHVPRSLFHQNFQGFKPFQARPILPDFSTPTERNLRIGLQGMLAERAQETSGILKKRIQDDGNALGNEKANKNVQALTKILNRHTPLIEEARRLLTDLISFATEHGAAVNGDLALKGIVVARNLIKELSAEVGALPNADTMRVSILAHDQVFGAVTQFLDDFARLPIG